MYTAMSTLIVAMFTFVACFIIVPMLLGMLRIFGIYAIVNERQYFVYVLFGKVIGYLDEPGLHFLPAKLGWKAFIVNILGKCNVLDMRLDQRYLRSQQVNSEEGAPMGIGIWYEMYISDPVAYLFKNADPQGSLAANVSNAVVRCLSNMPLADMLETRHNMSLAVRQEVSPKSHEWGYRLGSIYIRKVHFRDAGMTRQIEEKVVNRLRQVTSAIKQDGANQVNIITSTAEREAAIEFARADAIHPSIVGDALKVICQDHDITEALFQVLESERIIANPGNLTLIPSNSGILTPLLAAAAKDPSSSAPQTPKPESAPKRAPEPPPVEQRATPATPFAQLKELGQEAMSAYLQDAGAKIFSKMQR